MSFHNSGKGSIFRGLFYKKSKTMERAFKVIILVLLFGAQSAFSQCNQYYQFEQGSEWEMETYNSKGKLTGRIQQNVVHFQQSGIGFDAVVNSIFYNEKGKELTKGDLSFKCDDGIIYIDMRNFIPEEQMKAFGDYEIQMEAENLEFPNSLSVGQTLSEGSITMTAVGSALPIKMNCVISDRKVIGKESLTTPAGTFECYKISSKSTLKNQMGINMTFNFSAIEWIAPKVGVVKSESYNKNDKLVGYTLLTHRK